MAQPRVSTAESFLTTAFLALMRWTPRARLTVTIAGRPSGMAATARLTPARNMSCTGSPRAIPMATTHEHTPRQAMTRPLPSCARRF